MFLCNLYECLYSWGSTRNSPIILVTTPFRFPPMSPELHLSYLSIASQYSPLLSVINLYTAGFRPTIVSESPTGVESLHIQKHKTSIFHPEYSDMPIPPQNVRHWNSEAQFLVKALSWISNILITVCFNQSPTHRAVYLLTWTQDPNPLLSPRSEILGVASQFLCRSSLSSIW